MQEILEFFNPYGNWWWKAMPMGDLNTAPKFVAMVMKIQMKWDALAKERRLKFFV